MTTSSLMPYDVVIPRLSHKSVEWYTPTRYIQLVREVLGSIALVWSDRYDSQKCFASRIKEVRTDIGRKSIDRSSYL